MGLRGLSLTWVWTGEAQGAGRGAKAEGSLGSPARRVRGVRSVQDDGGGCGWMGQSQATCCGWGASAGVGLVLGVGWRSLGRPAHSSSRLPQLSWLLVLGLEEGAALEAHWACTGQERGCAHAGGHVRAHCPSSSRCLKTPCSPGSLDHFPRGIDVLFWAVCPPLHCADRHTSF